MSDTIREIIISDFTTRAAALTTSPGGYNYGFASSVLRAQVNVDPGDLPAVIIFPGNEISEPSIYGTNVITMPIRIEGLVEYGSDDPSEVSEKILGDLIKCFTSASWSRSPDYIDSITYTGGGPTEVIDETVAGAWITVNVKYQTNIGDPYSQ